ncbi:UNVERIFIED_CONTAM: hypothetical protein RMT77_008196 [Armadillidium vulgare]
MGNVTAKQLRPKSSNSPPIYLKRKESTRKSSSGSSDSSSQEDYIDAASEFQTCCPEEEEEEDQDGSFDEYLTRPQELEMLNRSQEDAFMKAVLSFCAHMGGRMDSLDNARLYDEFCSYAAAHRPNLGVA